MCPIEPRTKRPPMRASILYASWLAVAPVVHALDSDREQPMRIEADQVTVDEREGVSTYVGQVVVVQGTLRLEAHTLTVHMDGGQVQRLQAEGEPAVYRQRPEGKQEDVVARAAKLDYQAAQQTLVLEGDAQVQQGQHSFASRRIDYDLAEDRVQAGKAGGGERVKIVIQPQSTP